MGRTDQTDVATVVKDRNDGSRDIELVMNSETGEMEAVPKSQADKMKGAKAGTIAEEPFWRVI